MARHRDTARAAGIRHNARVSAPAHKPPRILHFASGDLWGGAEALVLALLREQQRRNPGGVACVLMNAGRLADELAGLSIRTLVLDETRQGVRELAARSAAFSAEFSPAVLHAHRRKENLVAVLASLRRGRPVRITTVHGMPEPVRARNRVKRRIVEFVNDFTLTAGFDAIVGVSHDIETRMRARYPRSRVVCVYNGIEQRTAAPAPLDGRVADDAPLRLLALGRLVPVKRFERLAAVSDALATDLPRPRITLAGDGPLQAELTRQLQPQRAQSGIDMPGFVADIDGLFASHDALLITSDHEGIPMAVLEALVRGIPVFGFAVGGLPEILADDVPLHLAAPGDCQGLARAIRAHFAAPRDATRRFPPAGWKFGIEHCADEYERLYASLSG
jgi:glycosyltransferase involved in cell wall biosynthesis